MAEEHLALLRGASPVLLALLLAALLVALVLEARRRAKVGPPAAPGAGPVARGTWRGELRARRARLLRALPPLVLLALLALIAQTSAEPQTAFESLATAIECLAVAAVVAWLTPARTELVIGTGGLQRGAQAWAWSELEGPRLEGQLLSFALPGAPARRERIAIPALVLPQVVAQLEVRAAPAALDVGALSAPQQHGPR